MPAPPLYVSSNVYRDTGYAPHHPLAIPRVSLTTDLVRALGWIGDDRYVDSPSATIEQLARFHRSDYIEALADADRRQQMSAEVRERHNIGGFENPVFAGMFARPATACGGSIRAAELAAEGRRVYHPAGGTHHGRPDRASGFCYFNDPVLAILSLLDRGLARVAYVDIDAHHGDGVEAAFAGDPRVLCLSVHEAGRWPYSGAASDRAGGSARNLPVPAGLNDDEMDYIAERALMPLLEAFGPDAVVVQGGADALADDPLSRLQLSNGALWRVVARLMAIASRMVVLGGGGYNPWAVARCWAGMWATLNGFSAPARLPPEAETLLRQVQWRRLNGRRAPERWFVTLADEPRQGPVREAVKRLVAEVVAP